MIPDPKTTTGSLTRAERVTETAALAEAAEVIPVVQEVVHVGKQEVERGRVTVHKTVQERDETVEMLLKRTDVSVERVPLNQTVTEAPHSRQEGDILIVPILEEVVVVEKRLVLKEELRIRLTTSERTAQETVRLRSEKVEINHTGDVSVPTAEISKEG